MKTLHMTNAWHATSGGIATFYRALMDGANRRGHEMRLVVPGKEDKVESVGRHVRIYYLASPPSPINRQYRMILPKKYLLRESRLRQVLNAERPDLVEICDKYTLNYFAGMLRHGMLGDVGCRPIVIGLSCERMDDNVRAYFGWNLLAETLTKLYMRWLYFPLFHHHIANSQYTAEELRTASLRHSVRRGVWVRPMGAHFHDFSPACRSAVVRRHLLRRANADSEAKLLLYVGRLVPEKNLGLLLDTVQELENKNTEDYRLIVVGDGLERESFLNEAERRVPGKIVWFGHVNDRAELARIYANCDVFVHPNPREPFGIAPLEAMAAGVPVVAPNVGGVTTYASVKNAWTVAPEAREFATAVVAALSRGIDCELRIAEALRTAASCQWENVAASFLDLYEDLVGTAQNAAHRLPADFYSTFPEGRGSAKVRIANALQRLLAIR